jgi:hypothetical protein
MREALETLDAGMPANRLVRISRKRQKDGWIAVTPFDPQPEPPTRPLNPKTVVPRTSIGPQAIDNLRRSKSNWSR